MSPQSPEKTPVYLTLRGEHASELVTDNPGIDLDDPDLPGTQIKVNAFQKELGGRTWEQRRSLPPPIIRDDITWAILSMPPPEPSELEQWGPRVIKQGSEGSYGFEVPEDGMITATVIKAQRGRLFRCLGLDELLGFFRENPDLTAESQGQAVQIAMRHFQDKPLQQWFNSLGHLDATEGSEEGGKTGNIIVSVPEDLRMDELIPGIKEDGHERALKENTSTTPDHWTARTGGVVPGRIEQIEPIQTTDAIKVSDEEWAAVQEAIEKEDGAWLFRIAYPHIGRILAKRGSFLTITNGEETVLARITDALFMQGGLSYGLHMDRFPKDEARLQRQIDALTDGERHDNYTQKAMAFRVETFSLPTQITAPVSAQLMIDARETDGTLYRCLSSAEIHQLLADNPDLDLSQPTGLAGRKVTLQIRPYEPGIHSTWHRMLDGDPQQARRVNHGHVIVRIDPNETIPAADHHVFDEHRPTSDETVTAVIQGVHPFPVKEHLEARMEDYRKIQEGKSITKLKLLGKVSTGVQMLYCSDDPDDPGIPVLIREVAKFDDWETAYEDDRLTLTDQQRQLQLGRRQRERHNDEDAKFGEKHHGVRLYVMEPLPARYGNFTDETKQPRRKEQARTQERAPRRQRPSRQRGHRRQRPSRQR